MKGFAIAGIIIAILVMILAVILDFTAISLRTDSGYGISTDFFYFLSIFVGILAILISV